ncbi:hypothetical protein DJ71_11120 [Halorubrum sp. E3]|nr:hypothetical protein DJ71_11120 [Halorubrum sp. E3]
MTSKSVATALTLYRSRTLTLEQAATVGGCSSVSVRERYSVSAVATDLDVIGYIQPMAGRTYNSNAV